MCIRDSIWFVIGLGFGVEGVAIATLIAEWFGLLLGLFLCRSAVFSISWALCRQIIDRARILRMAQVNGDILIRSVLLQAGFVSFLFFAADLGDVTLAANQVLLQFCYVAAHAMDGFVFAAEALVSQAVGAGALAKLRRAAMITAIWTFSAGLVISFMIWFLAPIFIDIMAKEINVQADARLYIVHIAFVPILGAMAWMLDGVFIGATRTRDMRNMMIISFIGYSIFLIILLPAFGNHGLWMAMNGFYILRGLTLAVRYPALERSVTKL